MMTTVRYPAHRHCPNRHSVTITLRSPSGSTYTYDYYLKFLRISCCSQYYRYTRYFIYLRAHTLQIYLCFLLLNFIAKFRFLGWDCSGGIDWKGLLGIGCSVGVDGEGLLGRDCSGGIDREGLLGRGCSVGVAR